MKSRKIIIPVFALSLLMSGAACAFSIPKVPGLAGGSSSSSSVSAADVAKNARNALHSFAKAELGILAALGGYEELAAQQQLLENMKTGDVAASKEDVEAIINISTAANKAIQEKAGANNTLDADQKAAAGNATVEYVKGLVSSKNLVSSVQGLAKNPMSLGADAGVILYLGKELPSVISNGASTTSSIFKYMGANGVDMSEAKKAAKDLGV